MSITLSDEQKKLYELKVMFQLMKEFIAINVLTEEWNAYLERHIQRNGLLQIH